MGKKARMKCSLDFLALLIGAAGAVTTCRAYFGTSTTEGGLSVPTTECGSTEETALNTDAANCAANSGTTACAITAPSCYVEETCGGDVVECHTELAIFVGVYELWGMCAEKTQGTFGGLARAGCDGVENGLCPAGLHGDETEGASVL